MGFSFISPPEQRWTVAQTSSSGLFSLLTYDHASFQSECGLDECSGVEQIWATTILLSTKCFNFFFNLKAAFLILYVEGVRMQFQKAILILRD